MSSRKTVLSVGQCRPDQAAISHFLAASFDAEVLTADFARQVLPLLQSNPVDLVVVNRILDADGDDGMAIVSQIRNEPTLQNIPVMLVSNFPEWQDKAVQAGAVPGFGKAELNKPGTRARVAQALGLAD